MDSFHSLLEIGDEFDESDIMNNIINDDDDDEDDPLLEVARQHHQQQQQSNPEDSDDIHLHNLLKTMFDATNNDTSMISSQEASYRASAAGAAENQQNILPIPLNLVQQAAANEQNNVVVTPNRQRQRQPQYVDLTEETSPIPYPHPENNYQQQQQQQQLNHQSVARNAAMASLMHQRQLLQQQENFLIHNNNPMARVTMLPAGPAFFHQYPINPLVGAVPGGNIQPFGNHNANNNNNNADNNSNNAASSGNNNPLNDTKNRLSLLELKALMAQPYFDASGMPDPPRLCSQKKKKKKKRRKRNEESEEEEDEDGTSSNEDTAKIPKLPRIRTKELFPEKLHRLIRESEERGHGYIIGFRPHGRAFSIYKSEEFVKKVMPLYFKQSHLSSFQRQLNLYGFTRISSGLDTGAYYHPFFLKGRPSLTGHMRRITCDAHHQLLGRSTSRQRNILRAQGRSPDFYAMTPSLPDDDILEVGTVPPDQRKKEAK